MDPRSAAGQVPTGEPPAPPRQRWRLVLARSSDAPTIAGREQADAWERAIEATALPIHRGLGRPRPRVALGAQLPAGVAAERELADIVLGEVLPIWRVREALLGRLPAGWTLIDLYDVWLGSPALAGQVAGAIYRVDVGGATDAAAVARAASDLMASERLPRTRLKGGSEMVYDLRPLVIEIAVVAPGPPVVVCMRTKIHPELGSGRPEEVLAALAEQVGSPLAPGHMVRERLILADDTA